MGTSIINEDFESGSSPRTRPGFFRRVLSRIGYYPFRWIYNSALSTIIEDLEYKVAELKAELKQQKRIADDEIESLTHQAKFACKLYDASVARLDVLIATCERERKRIRE